MPSNSPVHNEVGWPPDKREPQKSTNNVDKQHQDTYIATVVSRMALPVFAHQAITKTQSQVDRIQKIVTRLSDHQAEPADDLLCFTLESLLMHISDARTHFVDMIHQLYTTDPSQYTTLNVNQKVAVATRLLHLCNQLMSVTTAVHTVCSNLQYNDNSELLVLDWSQDQRLIVQALSAASLQLIVNAENTVSQTEVSTIIRDGSSVLQSQRHTGQKRQLPPVPLMQPAQQHTSTNSSSLDGAEMKKIKHSVARTQQSTTDTSTRVVNDDAQVVSNGDCNECSLCCRELLSTGAEYTMNCYGSRITSDAYTKH